MGLNDGENRTKGENCTSIIYSKVKLKSHYYSYCKPSLANTASTPCDLCCFVLLGIVVSLGGWWLAIRLLVVLGDDHGGAGELPQVGDAVVLGDVDAARRPQQEREATPDDGHPLLPLPLRPPMFHLLASWILYIAVIRDGLFPDSRPLVTPPPRNYGALTSYRAPTRLLEKKATENCPPLILGAT